MSIYNPLLYFVVIFIHQVPNSSRHLGTRTNAQDSQGIAKGLARRIAGGLIIGILLPSGKTRQNDWMHSGNPPQKYGYIMFLWALENPQHQV